MLQTGFSSNTDFKGYKVEDEKNKLTIEEMNAYVLDRRHCENKTPVLTLADNYSRYDMYKDIEEGLARQKNVPFTAKYTRGLPFGLKMSNGVTVGES